MSFDRPLFAASSLILFFASFPLVGVLSFLAEGVDLGVALGIRGVIGRGIVKGFTIGPVWVCGPGVEPLSVSWVGLKPRPGGTDVLPLSKENLVSSISSSSATRASTDDVTSSRGKRSSSRVKYVSYWDRN
ncbi:hypothetical protein GGR53DRAFT_287874 [Hypoxylon sp. FL1150]|nr:hypothetical protein GGR53DRAFT_287874 [Hypoxylon sp. FL1150]